MKSESNKSELVGDEFGSSKKCVIVLGMHRSGTSCLTGCLQEAGLAADNVHRSNKDNNKGNRESIVVQRINRELLKENNSSWDKPSSLLQSTEKLEQARDHFITKLNTEHSHWVMKDPRLLFTLSFWKEALPPTQFIGTFRHPLKAALSLWQRDNLSIEDGISLWLQYNRKLLDEYKLRSFPLICFDLSAEQYKAKLEEILFEVRKMLTHSESFNLEKGLNFYSETLLHQMDVEIYKESLSPENPKAFELYNNCLDLYKELLSLSKADVVYTNRAKADLTLIPLRPSLKVYAEILALQPNNAVVIYMKGTLHEMNEEFELAIQLYNKAAALAPHHYWIFIKLGGLYEKLQLWNKASKCYTTAQKHHPLNNSFSISLANVYLNLNEDNKAINLLMSLSFTNSSDLSVLNSLINVLDKQDRIDDAKSILQIRLKNENIDTEWVLLKIGQLERKQKNWTKAMEIFEKLASTSNNTQYLNVVWNNIAELNFELERYDNAVQAAYNAIDISPDNFHTYAVLVNIFMKERDWKTALEYSDKAIALDDSKFSAYPKRALLFLKLKELEKAEDAFQVGMALDPNNSHLISIGAHIALQSRSNDVACKRYQKAIEMSHPNPAYLYSIISEIKLAEGQIDEAEKYIKKAIQLEPDNAKYKSKLDEITNRG